MTATSELPSAAVKVLPEVSVAVLSGPKIYRFSISGSVAKLVGKVNLRKSYSDSSFSVADGLVVADSGGYGHIVRFWQYPAGGKATKTIGRFGEGPRGITISQPSSRR